VPHIIAIVGSQNIIFQSLQSHQEKKFHLVLLLCAVKGKSPREKKLNRRKKDPKYLDAFEKRQARGDGEKKKHFCGWLCAVPKCIFPSVVVG
jgi:hypothetical protein